MAKAAHPPIEEIRNDLARAIRSKRSDCVPHETARQLLEYHRPGNTGLVGIDTEATTAVLYHERDRYTSGVSFGPDGLEEGGAKLADFEFGTNIYSWVRQMDAYWGWLPPRYSDLW